MVKKTKVIKEILVNSQDSDEKLKNSNSNENNIEDLNKKSASTSTTDDEKNLILNNLIRKRELYTLEQIKSLHDTIDLNNLIAFVKNHQQLLKIGFQPNELFAQMMWDRNFLGLEKLLKVFRFFKTFLHDSDIKKLMTFPKKLFLGEWFDKLKRSGFLNQDIIEIIITTNGWDNFEIISLCADVLKPFEPNQIIDIINHPLGTFRLNFLVSMIDIWSSMSFSPINMIRLIKLIESPNSTDIFNSLHKHTKNLVALGFEPQLIIDIACQEQSDLKLGILMQFAQTNFFSMRMLIICAYKDSSWLKLFFIYIHQNILKDLNFSEAQMLSIADSPNKDYIIQILPLIKDLGFESQRHFNIFFNSVAPLTILCLSTNYQKLKDANFTFDLLLPLLIPPFGSIQIQYLVDCLFQDQCLGYTPKEMIDKAKLYEPKLNLEQFIPSSRPLELVGTFSSTPLSNSTPTRRSQNSIAFSQHNMWNSQAINTATLPNKLRKISNDTPENRLNFP